MVLERKIYFYRILLKNNGQLVDPQTVFTHINTLPFDENGRYQSLDNGNINSVFVDSEIFPLRVRIGTKRMRGLPLVENRGQTTPLTIPVDSGLYEPMHCIIFPNNIAAFESNFYAPRPNQLKSYVLSKAAGIIDDIELIPLMRTDVDAYLRRVGDIRAFTLKVNRNMGNFIEEISDNLSNGFRGLRQATDSVNIEVVLRCDRNSRNGMDLSFRDLIPNWLAREDVRSGVDKLVIRGRDEESGRIDNFDLLQQYLLSTKQVVTQDEIHRSVNTGAMYRAINEAYVELRSEINFIINPPNQTNER